jgi:flagellin-like protein
MKGISAVIATILMLMITIALAGTAYLYITGVFTSRTGVVLSVEQATSCAVSNGNITVWIRNDGTGVASVSSVTITNSSGNPSGANCYGVPGLLINAGGSASTACSARCCGSGLYAITVSGGSSSAQGSIYCAS